ncbi:MAG: putative membrane protein [Planctomycetota bacterium]|jgi:uncharacterized membrane protein
MAATLDRWAGGVETGGARCVSSAVSNSVHHFAIAHILRPISRNGFALLDSQSNLYLTMLSSIPPLLLEMPSTESWLPALGRSHVMLIHFPIGLIYMAALMEMVHALRKQPGRSPTAFACLGVGSLSAILAAAVGWLHADLEPLGSSVADVLFRHRWLGVVSAASALISFGFSIFATNNDTARRLYRWILTLSFLTVTVGAHYGGTLVYGTGYLFGYEAPSSAPIQEAVESGSVAEPESLYSSKIHPLFELRCVECHGSKRQKGDLRLDDLTQHFKDEQQYWRIVPGDAEGSTLYQRILLPASDDDVMPAKGDLLSSEEIALVKKWIDAGAEWKPTPAAQPE